MVEEIYTDKDNTDQLVTLKSAARAPYIVTVAVMRDARGDDIVIMDCDSLECQCVDQLVHFCVSADLRVSGFQQTKGLNSRRQPCALPANLFSSKNLERVLGQKVN